MPARDLVVISLGAGVQSTCMSLMAKHGELTPMPDAAIFADTGWEPQPVYTHLDWLETVLPFPVSRVSAGDLRADHVRAVNENGRVSTIPAFVAGEGQTAIIRRSCTRDYKIVPINREVRRLLGLKPRQRIGKLTVEQWHGISLDEAMRMKPAKQPWINVRWPLIEEGMTRHSCLLWMERNGYPTPPKSACIGCPYHNNEFWRDMKNNQPDDFADAVEFDAVIREGLPGVKSKAYLHRSLLPLAEVNLDNAEDMGQTNMFNNECGGYCGV